MASEATCWAVIDPRTQKVWTLTGAAYPAFTNERDATVSRMWDERFRDAFNLAVRTAR